MTLAEILIAAVTVFVAAFGLRYARAAAVAAKEAANINREGLWEARKAGHEAWLVRKRDHVLRVESALRLAYDAALRGASDHDWQPWRQAFAVSLIGLDEELPKCAYLATNTLLELLSKTEDARAEIVQLIREIDEELAVLPAAYRGLMEGEDVLKEVEAELAAQSDGPAPKSHWAFLSKLRKLGRSEKTAPA